MPDIFDEIIDCLSQSDIKKILAYNSDCSRYCSTVDDLVNKAQDVKINQMRKELKKEIADIKAMTEENKNLISKIKKDLEVQDCSEEPDDCEQSIKAYMMKINELKNQVKILTKDFGDIDLEELFNDVQSLNEQVEEYKKKIAEMKKANEYYEGFPPDIEQAKIAIEKVKEQIKINEAKVESFY